MGGTSVASIAASTYHRLKQRLGISSPTRVSDVYQMVAEVERPVMERRGADVVTLRRTYPFVELGTRGDRWKSWELPDGTLADVARETEANVRLLAPGGGYVCAAVHNIQAGVRPENVVALFETARRITIP